mgnify:CR=1 FL=1
MNEFDLYLHPKFQHLFSLKGDDVLDLDELNAALKKEGLLWVRVTFGPVQKAYKALTPAPYDPVALLVPHSEEVELSLSRTVDNNQLRMAFFYALGLIGLKKIRPDDEYALWVSKQDLQFRGQQGWSYEVKGSYPNWFTSPVKKIESLDECSAKEKALLGLWQLIGEKIGTAHNLHPLAVEYQQAAYQRQAAERLLSQLEDYSGAMLCDDVGLGKTYIATTVMVHYANWWHERCKEKGVIEHEDPFRITVLAPNSVVSTWQREAIPPLSAFGVPINHIRVLSHNKFSRITSNSGVLAREHNRLSDLGHLMASDLVIVDEAHNFRSVTATRTQVLRDFLRLQPRKDTLRKVLLLTATPINNSLDDLEQELSLMFSTEVRLSDKATVESYRKHALEKIQSMCERAVKAKQNKNNLAPLILYGKANYKLTQKTDFRKGLDFGPQIADLKKYLKEQNRALEQLQARVRIEAENNQSPEEISKKEPAITQSRIAGELLDRIVVQRSRSLCKAIEKQQNSNVEILFRPDAAEPERLYYDDKFETENVLQTFLPLFGDVSEDSYGDDHEGSQALSFKAYMWYDVREGIKSANETSSVIGLQRALVLKRLESSPVAFLITMLRLLVLHARHLNELSSLCRSCQDSDRSDALEAELDIVKSNVSDSARQKMLALVTRASFDLNVAQGDIINQLAKQYNGEAAKLHLEDDIPLQAKFGFFDENDEEETPEKEMLQRLWSLKDFLIQDFETLLRVVPQVASLVFNQFKIKEWPRNFCEGKELITWPKTESWARRLITDEKLCQLVKRLVLARRDNQKVIVFSQFTDSLTYVYSVIEALQELDQQTQSALCARFSRKSELSITQDEIKSLLKVIEKVTGDTEDRDEVVNRFAPYYRIGPTPPKIDANEFDELFEIEQIELVKQWKDSWRAAMHAPLDVLFASDVLAEGVNLQDAALLINWDVHWNPVKMIQRAGRIDRRLNPAIETKQEWPALHKLAKQEGCAVPEYFWHTHQDTAPVTVNMILPDELEQELNLRERIASKTLAIDFTLGLEQGTGAEADWMGSYKYQGVKSLNAFQKERAIETIATLHQKIARLFLDKGIRQEWADSLDSWIVEKDSSKVSPILAMSYMGLEEIEDSYNNYSRVITPVIKENTPMWMWTEQRPQESGLNHWLVIDGENLPPETISETTWKPQYSQPISPEILLILVSHILDEKSEYKELNVDDYGMALMQGLSAISAGFFGSDHDREELEPSSYLLIQSSVLQNYLMDL